MAGTTTAVATSAKSEFLSATHNLAAAGDVLKFALVKATPTGTYGAATTNYSNLTGNSDEVTGTGYTAGGATVTNQNVATSGTTAYWTPSANLSWTSATFTATGGIQYNSSKSNKVISVHDFGGSQTVSAGTFTVLMPTNDSTHALLQLN